MAAYGKADSEMTMAMLMAMPMTATVVVTATEQLTVLVTVPLGQTVLLRAPWRAWWQAHWQCYPDGSVWWADSTMIMTMMMMAMPMTTTTVATATAKQTVLLMAPLAGLLLQAPWEAWSQAHCQCIWQCHPNGSVHHTLPQWW
jgi:hypothetical protein